MKSPLSSAIHISVHITLFLCLQHPCLTTLFNINLSVMHGSLQRFACNIAISMEDFKNKVKPYLFTRINQQILLSFFFKFCISLNLIIACCVVAL